MALLKNVASSNSDFSLDLFKVLKSSFEGKNFVFSPFSLHSVMAMVQVGVKEGCKTWEEIAKTFHYPRDNMVLEKGYASLLARMRMMESLDETGYTLFAANKVYANLDLRINPSYSKGIHDNFLTEIEQVDFSKNVESAANINGWVEKTTFGKIKNLVEPGSLIGASLVLVNGIYFKSLWKNQFKPETTKKEPFHLNEKDQIDAQIMVQTQKFRYGSLDGETHAVALPYKEDRLCMIIIAPKQITDAGIKKMVDNFSSYGSVLDKLEDEKKVMVRLPRFKIECRMALVPVLQQMGLSSIFTPSAELDGILADKGPSLFVTDVIQKAFIEVNEEGTEAAAATAIRMTRSIQIPTPPIEFNADRPFLFQIVDLETNFVLFVGKCSNPNDNQ